MASSSSSQNSSFLNPSLQEYSQLFSNLPLKTKALSASSSHPVTQTAQRVFAPNGDDATLLRRSLLSDQDIAHYSLLGSSFPPIFSHFTPAQCLTLITLFSADGLCTETIDGMDNYHADLLMWESLLVGLIDSAASKSNDPEYPALDQSLNFLLTALRQLLTNSWQHENQIAKRTSDQQAITRHATEVMEKIRALPVGESFAFKSGYTNTRDLEGHAEIFQFVKREKNTYDLLIFTSTNHPLATNIQGAKKTFIVPLITYLGIPDHELFFSSDGIPRPAILEQLFYIASSFQSTSRSAMNSNDQIIALSPLERYRTPLSFAKASLITGQRGGSCCVAVTKKWIRFKLKNLGLTKQLLFYAHLQVMIKGFQQLESPLNNFSDPLNLQVRRVFKTIAESMLKRVVKYGSDCYKLDLLIAPKALKKAQATAQDILNQLTLLEKTSLQFHSEQPTEQEAIKVLSTTASLQRAQAIASTGTFVMENTTLEPPTLFYPHTCHHHNPLEVFSTLAAVCKKLPMQQPSPEAAHAIRTFIDTTLEQIPFPHVESILPQPVAASSSSQTPTNIWDTYTDVQLIQLQNAISNVLTVYCQVDFYNQPPEKALATAFSLHIISHFIAIRREQISGQDLLCRYPILDYYDYYSAPDLLFLHYRSYRRIQHAIDYIHRFNTHIHTALKGVHDPLFLHLHLKRGAVANGHGTIHYTIQRPPKGSYPYVSSSNSTSGKIDSTSLVYARLLQNDSALKDLIRPLFSDIPIHEHTANMLAISIFLGGDSSAAASLCVSICRALPADPMDRYGRPRQYTPDFKAEPRRRLSQFIQSKYANLIYLHAAQLNLSSLLSGCSISTPQPSISHYNVSVELRFGRFLPSEPSFRRSDFPQAFAPYRNKPIFHPDSSQWKELEAESKLVHTPSSDDAHAHIVSRLQRTLTEWQLSPIQILHELNECPEVLHDSQVRHLVFKLFFRSPILFSEDTPHLTLGAGELITSDTALRDLAVEFIRRGILLGKKNPAHFDVANFCLELSFYLARFLKDQGFHTLAEPFDHQQTIQEWSLETPPKQAHQNVLDIYRILFLCLDEVGSPDNTVEIFRLWINYNSNRVHNDDAIFHDVIYMATNDITRLCRKLFDPKNIAILQHVGEKLFPLVFPASAIPTECIVDLKRKAPYLSFGQYALNLLRGRGLIRTKNGLCTLSKEFVPVRTIEAKRLFDQLSHLPLTLVHGETHLKHPTAGFITPMSVSMNNSAFFRLFFRKFPGCQHDYYYASENIATTKSLKIPAPIYHDYACWRSHEQGEYAAIFTEFHDLMHVTHVLLHNGKLHTASLKEGRIVYDPHTHIDSLSELQNHSNAILDAFELPIHVLGVFDQNDSLIELQFPRYVSEQGNLFRFTLHNGQFVWTENKNFFISPSSHRNLLHGFSDYLQLESHSLEKILLIPFHLAADTQRVRMYDDTESKITASRPCFAFRWKEGKFSTTTHDEMLFLAYIHLLQQKFEDAFKFLRDINPHEPLTEHGRVVLKQILRSSSQLENHPDEVQATFLALIFLMKDYRIVMQSETANYFDSSSLQNNEREKITALLQNSCQSLNNISSFARLTPEEEIYLCTTVLGQQRAQSFVQRRSGISSAQSFIIANTDNPYENLLNVKSIASNFISIDDSVLRTALAIIDPLNQPNVNMLAVICTICKHKDRWNPSQKKEISYKLLQHYYQFLKISHTNSMYMTLCALLALSDQVAAGSWPTAADFDVGNLQKIKTLIINTYDRYKIGLRIQTFIRFSLTATTAHRHSPLYPAVFPSNPAETSLAPRLTRIQTKKPLSVTLTDPSTRWETLAGWKAQYLVIRPIDAQNYLNDLDLSHEAMGTTDAEPAVKRYIEALQHDYEIGKQLNLGRQVVSDVNTAGLKQSSHEMQEAVESGLAVNRLSLLRLLNKTREFLLERMTDESRLLGHVDRVLTFDDAIACLLSQNVEQYRMLNPLLQDEDIQEIIRLTLSILDGKAYLAQLKRIQKTCETLDACPPEEAQALRDQLLVEFEERYSFEEFSNQEQITLRIYAGQSGITPYREQLDLIRKMIEPHAVDPSRYRDCVAQLKMGGGKTAVLAPILLEMTTQKDGKIAVMIVPPALYESVKANLSRSYRQAFNKRLLAVNMCRKDFTPYKLGNLLELLTQAKTEKQPILTTSQTLLGLRLELLSIARKVTTLDENQTVDLFHRGQLICNILNIVKQECEVLVDEIEEVMSLKQKLIFSDGEQEPINPGRIPLVIKLLETMLSRDITVRIPQEEGTKVISLAEFFGLQHNLQSKIDIELYRQYLTPILANEIATTTSRSPHFIALATALKGKRKSFIRYVTGQMLDDLQSYLDRGEELPHTSGAASSSSHSYTPQEYTDLEFLRMRQALASSPNQSDRNVADLIAQTRHLLDTALPSTLKRVANRNFGPSLEPEKPGKIIPYQGVDAPDVTNYVDTSEQMLYQCFYALSNPVMPQTIEQIARTTLAEAELHHTRYGGEISEAPEFQAFVEIFSVSPIDISEADLMARAIKYVSEDPSKILDIQIRLIYQYVQSPSDWLEATGFTLYDMVCSCRGSSGTPGASVAGYPQGLAEGYIPSIGTMGSILHMLINKQTGNQVETFDFVNETLVEFIARFGDRDSLIDAAGENKVFGSHTLMAEVWNQALKAQGDAEDKAVLYFDRAPGEMQPNTLHAYRTDGTVPEKIGSTERATIEEKGLQPRFNRVLFDEKHTIGSDIWQKPTARGILTVDGQTTLRILAQALFRLRQISYAQSCDFLLAIHSVKRMRNEGRTLLDILYQAAFVEARDNPELILDSFLKQIDFLPKFIAENQIINAFQQRNFDYMKLYLPFCAQQYNDDPYLQSGRLTPLTPSLELLLQKLTTTGSTFLEAIKEQDPATARKAGKAIGQLQPWIEANHPYFPEQTKESLAANSQDGHVEMLQEVNQENQNENQRQSELQLQLQAELQAYENIDAGVPLQETPIPYETFIDLVRSVQNFSFHERLIRLHDQLQKFPYTFRRQPLPLQQLFESPIYGTLHFFYSSQPHRSSSQPLLLPVFHRKTKPAEQILAIQGQKDELHFVLVSEHEAGTFKTYLHTHPMEGVWLIAPNGTPYEKSEYSAPFPLEKALPGLLEINAFRGDCKFLMKEQIGALTKRWLNKNYATKLTYFILRTGHMPLQKQILNSNPLFRLPDEAISENLLGSPDAIGRQRLQLESTHQGTWKPKTILELKLCTDPKKLQQLRQDFVPFLGVNPEAADEDNKRAVKWLSRRNIDIESHNQAIFACIQPFQIPYLAFDQVPYLPVNRVQHLNSIDQIKQGDTYALSRDQVTGLRQSQIELLTGINPEYYNALNASLGAALLPAEQIHTLSSSACLYLSVAQLNAFFALLAANPDHAERAAFVHRLSAAQHRQAHGNFIPFVNPVHITATQIQEITNPEVVRYVPVDNRVSDLSLNMVPHVQDQHIPFLSALQIAALPLSRLNQLTQDQLVSYLNHIFENKPQLTEVLGHLALEQIPWIPRQCCPYLTDPEAIRQVVNTPTLSFDALSNEQQTALLQSRERVQSCDVGQAPQLFQYITWRRGHEATFEYFTHEQMMRICSELHDPDELNAIPNSKIVYLNRTQIAQVPRSLTLYILGVSVLGLIPALTAWIGYVAVPIIWMFNQGEARKFAASITGGYRRYAHVFTAVIPGRF